MGIRQKYNALRVLRYSVIMIAQQLERLSLWEKIKANRNLSSSRVLCTGVIRNHATGQIKTTIHLILCIVARALVDCIRNFGRIITARYLMAMKSITKTEIRSITTLTTSNVSRQKNITRTMPACLQTRNGSRSENMLPVFAHSLWNGINQQQAARGTVNLDSGRGNMPRWLHIPVWNATKIIQLLISFLRILSTALATVEPPRAVSQALITSSDRARVAAKHSRLTSTAKQNAVLALARKLCAEDSNRRLHISFDPVGDNPPYGIFVSDGLDALRYLCARFDLKPGDVTVFKHNIWR